MKSFYLYPGKLVFTKEEAYITTILGSCVAVALYDKKNKYLGLNHYLIPKVPVGEKPSPRYGEFAIPTLIEEMEKLGSERKNLQAKVYGGGSVLGDVDIGIGIGLKNIDLAMTMLEQFKIPILEKNVGGEKSRKIIASNLNFAVEHILNKEPEFKSTKKVRVAIVDDSATVRNLFQNIFTKAGLDVVGTAADPYQARELIVKTRPDVITLDIEMPKMNGVVFLEKLMKHLPLPVVMVSSLGQQGEAALRSLELGAVEFIHKPSQFDPEILKQLAEVLVQKVTAAANTRVKATTTEAVVVEAESSVSRYDEPKELRYIGISGNIGSPESLERILASFAADTPAVIVANSTISVFLDAFVQKLKRNLKMQVEIVGADTVIRGGTIYFAPAGKHVKMTNPGRMTLTLQDSPPVWGQKPSGDTLLNSMATSAGEYSMGILLSGFGNDGVEGLKSIYSASGRTLVEEPTKCGFPHAIQKAIALGVAEMVVPNNEIATRIMAIRNSGVVWTKKSAS